MPHKKPFWCNDHRSIQWPAALALMLFLLLAASQSVAASDRQQPSPPSTPDSTVTVVQPLAASVSHTCAILESSGVMCWGENKDGQLGDGSTTRRNSPVRVQGLDAGVTAIGAGNDFTCALAAAGSVYCWGSNVDGQLGDGSGGDNFSPVMVSGLDSAATALAVGGSHACALTHSGGVFCWGRNHAGQAGGSEPRYNSAHAIDELSSGVIALAAGVSHTCALTESQEVLCWGGNFAGQLGDGTTTKRSTPAAVEGLNESITSIASGVFHTCALSGTGTVQCWGDNWHGKLGDGSEDDRHSPVAVQGLRGIVTRISAGRDHTCALMEGNELQCWGDNSYGQLGNDDPRTYVTQPDAVVEVEEGVIAIAAGDTHTCVLNEADDVQCWGQNNRGQLGNGSDATARVPVEVTKLKRGVTLISGIAAGFEHSCALTVRSEVYCWGRNVTGQVGDRTMIDQNTPVEAVGIDGEIAAIAAGWGHTCLLAKEGSVHCWGANGAGQLGMGNNFDRIDPIATEGLPVPVTAIAAGWDHTCALNEVGGLFCWGGNASGQLGDGSRMDRYRAVAVAGLESGIVAVTGGWGHTCALNDVGGVLCWGDNQGGQVGDGSMTNRTSPVAVPGLESDVTAIAAGAFHTCALMESGNVLCWGHNVDGQVGDGTYDDRSLPIDVSGLGNDIAAIAAGANHTCAMTRAGAVQCWGSNNFGELGNSNWPSPARPVDVEGLNGGVTAIAAGSHHTCALIGLVRVVCWGYNAGGQLGDGNFTNRGIPFTVSELNPGVTALTAGASHTCALSEAATVQCWGDNSAMQLGTDSTIGSGTPLTVTGLSQISAIASGPWYTCAVMEAGSVHCWGSNDYAQLGNGSASAPALPVAVNGLSGTVVDIATGGFHACILNDAGVVQCWGSNEYGQLGNDNLGVGNFSATPLVIAGLSNELVAISAGMYHTCALDRAGSVQCWGDNEYGQLGDGTSGTENYSAVPVTVQGLASGVVAIASAGYFNCALSAPGGVSCWGRNEEGQLGDGTEIDRTTAVGVRRLDSGVVAIATGLIHTCAVTESGGVQCWGNNGSGQLQVGNGTELGRPAPVTVEDVASGVTAIAAGGFHTCVLTQTGLVQCWGNNSFGQLGSTPGWVPVAVLLP